MSMAMVSAALLRAYEEASLTSYAGQVLSANQDLGIKVATPVGTVFGQLAFGWLADVFGRKRMCRSYGMAPSGVYTHQHALGRWH